VAKLQFTFKRCGGMPKVKDSALDFSTFMGKFSLLHVSLNFALQTWKLFTLKKATMQSLPSFGSSLKKEKSIDM
jgi:hypothetical protein